MPLPVGTSCSLHRGDLLQQAPKQAMIVRLSSETLQALQDFSLPAVDFEFGNTQVRVSCFTLAPMTLIVYAGHIRRR